MIHFLSFLLIAVLMGSCQGSTDTYTPNAPDYNDSVVWFTDRKNAAVDVFYVTPTCIFDWKHAPTGKTSHHYDVYGEVMKENFDYSLQLANAIFGEACNFYAPYYRQISLDSWLESDAVIDERFAVSMGDIHEAFQHYLTHFNEHRPFVLAGYSQGAKGVVELVKTMDAETLARMKAAYVIGYRITDEDLQHPNIRPAKDSTDRGVVICYHSVHHVEDVWPAVSKGNKVCINPVNWRTDSVAAHLNDTVTVRVDTEHRLLLVDGYEPNGGQIPLLQGTLTSGNYHLAELTLYQECLRENVKKRIRQ